LAAARSCGAATETLGIAARGPDDDELTIDVAWLGADNPSRELLHISGIHGVEAYAGSVTQLAVLGQPLLGGATTPAAYGTFAAVAQGRNLVYRAADWLFKGDTR
jgi:hypothetical protein